MTKHRWNAEFCSCGCDSVSCQKCGKRICGRLTKPVAGVGNVCFACGQVAYGWGHAGGKRSEKEVVADLANVYCALSPENLTMDGELNGKMVSIKRRALETKLAALIKEYGRPISEMEVYNKARALGV